MESRIRPPHVVLDRCLRGTRAFVAAIGLLTLGMIAEAGAQTPCQPEPNATNIAYGDVVDCAINPVGDTDIFRFEGAAGDTIVLQVLRLTGGEPCLQLSGPGIAAPIVSCVDVPFNSSVRIDRTLTQTGTFTILASEAGNDETTGYRIALERILPLPASAPPIVYGTTISSGVISPAGDLDVYFLTVSAGDSVTLTVSRLGGGEPCVQLFGLDRTVLTTACVDVPFNNSVTVTRTFTQSGSYPVLFFEAGGDEATTFALTAQCLAGPCAQAPLPPPPSPGACQPEPNGTLIAYGDLVDCAINPVSDSDVFRFEGAAGDTIVLQVLRLTGGEPCLQLSGPGITSPIVSCVDVPFNSSVRIDRTLTQTGTFTILAFEAGNDETTGYRIALERILPLPATAPPIVYGTTISSGVISPAGDLDVYFLTVSAGDNVTLTVSRLGGGEPCVQLFGLDRTVLTTACVDVPFNNSATITRTFTQSGSYPVLFFEAGSDETTTFAVTAQCLAGPCIVQNGGATVTSVTGTVQLTVQGEPTTLAPGSTLVVVKGSRLTTGADGQVRGGCSDGGQFTLSASSSLFLDDSLCQPSGSGMVDVTQGQFSLVAGSGAAAVADGRVAASPFGPGVRTPVNQVVIMGAGTDFTTTYTQVGSTGTASTVVRSGTVQVTDPTTGNVVTLGAGQQNTVVGQVPAIVAAVLPSSRSVRVGAAATVFATILNADQRKTAIVCGVSPITSVPATFSFQTTDPVNNQVTGSKSTPVAIPPRGAQNILIVLVPTAPLLPTDLSFTFTCGGVAAPVTVGVNTLLFSASADPVPDIVALAATTANDGIVTVPGATGTGFFAVATVNVGAGATITASADTGTASLPVTISLCQTNASAQCLAPPASGVTTPIAPNATPTFAIFVTGNATVPFDPGRNRIFVRFKDAAGVTRGSTSVAVRTQ